jgi:hypothetical protein
VPVYDLTASIKAGIARDQILAAYPTIQEHHLDLAVAYAEANPLTLQPRKWPPVVNGAVVKSGRIPRKTKWHPKHRNLWWRARNGIEPVESSL